MFLVATTRENVSPSLVLELLRRIGGIIKVRNTTYGALGIYGGYPCVHALHASVIPEIVTVRTDVLLASNRSASVAALTCSGHARPNSRSDSQQRLY